MVGGLQLEARAVYMSLEYYTELEKLKQVLCIRDGCKMKLLIVLRIAYLTKLGNLNFHHR